MNSPKKSSKEDPFCDFTDGTYTFAVFVVVENNSTPVFTEEYNSELTSFASMSSPGTYSGTTWQSSSKKYCSSSEDAILLSLLLFSVLLFRAVFLRLFVLMAIGTCSGTSGFSLLTPSGSAIFALVKAKRWWCPAKSFALWIFKSQSVHKNARSSRQTTETGLDLQISHGISFASCCVISIARSRDGLHFLVVTQRLHAVLFPHPTTNVASCGHISHFNFIVCS
mmetsp:Transcript_10188/g.29286  ORF Transcript_10188/g.29286 Transcript_10188/m.29286 type:complete len:224 (+) Transcript_10188:347-1018(+)